MFFELGVQGWSSCSILAFESKRLPYIFSLTPPPRPGTVPVFPFYSLSGGRHIFVPRTNCQNYCSHISFFHLPWFVWPGWPHAPAGSCGVPRGVRGDDKPIVRSLAPLPWRQSQMTLCRAVHCSE
uniref:Uncharacterized protein n=1 Tax=Arundo donax TaxID=35708 RepID=A0A0A9AC62_ARUDO